jgi:anti-anti-sigma factor
VKHATHPTSPFWRAGSTIHPTEKGLRAMLLLFAREEAIMDRSIALPDLNVEANQTSRGAVVHITGKLGAVEVESLGLPLLRLTAARCALVVLELSGLRSVSCLALGALEEFRRGLARWGGKVALAAPRSAVREAFERAGLADRFPVFETSDEALDRAA